MEKTLSLYTLSSLAKVFTNEICGEPFTRGSLLKNEEFSYQIAYTLSHCYNDKSELKLEVDSPLADSITIRQVVNVPSEFPAYLGPKQNYLRTTAGLYPDPLFPLEGDILEGVPYIYRAIWISVKPKPGVAAGSYPVRITLFDEKEDLRKTSEVTLEIIEAELPKQELLFTQWFHSDCIASYYDLEIFSEKHWEMIGKFMKTAADNGMNMILTPVVTPPLDTRIGLERPTVQLVDITKTGNEWTFGFEKLARWINLAQTSGISHFEIAHLFSQWGAKHAPKIVAMVDGTEKTVFGWDTDAFGEEYAAFLDVFLPALTGFLKDRGVAEQCWFHISDEPSLDAIETFRHHAKLLNKYLSGFRMLDALSNYEFYEEGLVKTPVAAVDHIEPFLEHNVNPLWAYYCCGQHIDVSNRFFSMPSARNRIIGEQLYKFQIEGFLQWGYNFYYSQLSKKKINPFLTTDADCAFPSGDAFSVYPGKDCVIESLRLKVFHEAMQDMRALRLLESRIGREEVMALIEEDVEPITFSKYPQEESYLLRLREKVNHRIQETN